MSVPFRETASPTLLRLNAEGAGFVEICISEPYVVRLHGHGVGIRRTKIPDADGFAFQRNQTQWEFNAWQQDIRFMLTAKQGNLRVDSDWDRTISKRLSIEFTSNAVFDDFEGVMEEFRGSWHERKYADSFQDVAASVAREYRDGWPTCRTCLRNSKPRLSWQPTLIGRRSLLARDYSPGRP